MTNVIEVETFLDPKFVGALAEREYAMSWLAPGLASGEIDMGAALRVLRGIYNLRAQEPTSDERFMADRAFKAATITVLEGFRWDIPESQFLLEHAADVLAQAIQDHCARCLMKYVAVETETGMALDFEARTVTRGVAEGRRKLPVVTDTERRPGLWRCDNCARFVGGWASDAI